ncbi:sulfite exporter TauE/SafE family protein [Aliiglaciecola sp.]|nr:sulfite exporter TauE/SafE family protein [Aliiglaciecola sp.]
MFVMLLLSALIVGLSLGLLGAGGSILTVPALMLLLGMEEKVAIASSLIIVAAIAFTGLLNAARKKVLETNILLWFALASIPAASIGAYMGVLLPEGMQTILLVIVMLFAAYKMFFPNTQPNAYQQNKVKLLVSGAAAGLVTGLVGVGGGFLMVPALIIYAGLNMQKAVANSLVLIAINASFAFITLQLSNQSMQLDWLVIAVMAIVGSLSVLIGQKVASKLNQQLLKRAFALILLFVGVGLLIHLFLL